ncbi:calcium-independent protein kinase C-like [Oppia nitens]|uniref:calcium-independent protein kinase C-like n=1 Tax=Oppia nitens TaxID=1686743 RepID=UPI0023DB7F8F|nr:calcium-independent protein kinase C-like [Oppia nitens]
MINQRISRRSQSTEMGFSKLNTRKIGRMYTSPSLDRLNASFESPRNPLLIRQRSIYDLSSSDTSDRYRMSSAVSQRNLNLQRLRPTVWRESISYNESIPRTTTLYNGSNYLNHSRNTQRMTDPISVLDRRDNLMTQLNSMSSTTINRRPICHVSNKSGLMSSKHHWPIITVDSHNTWRARLRERPLLSKLSVKICSKTKPLISNKTSSNTSSRTSSTNSSIKLNQSDVKEGSCGIYRNRHIIKFRERDHNLGQTATERRASISWELSKNQTDPNLQKTKNEETINELKSITNEHLIDRTDVNEFQTKDNNSQFVTDIIAIQTAVAMPEPSGAPIALLHQKPTSLKLKTPLIDPTINTNENITDKTKSPKKKKVKKKDVSKEKSKIEKKQEVQQQENEMQNVIKVLPQKDLINEKIGYKVEPKDVKQNILNEVDLNHNKNKAKVESLVPKRIRFKKYTFEDFHLIKVLGRGSFGKVLLAELKDHSIYFAIKCLKKYSVIEDDDIDSIMIERKVLAYGSSHPFICKLFCTFQTQSYLCFAMEWCCGGDLMFHVQKSGKFDENKARFYASEILCAVEFMHSKGIIYRDLKLDNIMIDHKGHIRLVDFGMCQGKIYREDLLPCNFCGTPEYMAPEIIKGVKYNQSVDFWSFGVLLYEMVVGTSPFHGTDEDELLWNVCNEEIFYPLYLSQNIKKILVLLLNKIPEKRLGMPTSGLDSIRSQPFFQGIEWLLVEKCQLKPPFIPNTNSAIDVSYFDLYFTKEEPTLTPISEQITQSIDQTLFKGFSYTNHKMTD